MSDLRQSQKLEIVNPDKSGYRGIGRTPRPGHPRGSVRWVLSPHPRHLPLGEGEPLSSRRTIQTRRLSTARCPLFPLPEGEGQGEGKGHGLPSRVCIGLFPELSNWASPPAEPEYVFSVLGTSRCDVRAACSGATPSIASVARKCVPPATTRAGTARRAVPTFAINKYAPEVCLNDYERCRFFERG